MNAIQILVTLGILAGILMIVDVLFCGCVILDYSMVDVLAR